MKSTASNYIVRMTALALAAALTACGGGGSSDATSTAPITPQVQETLVPLVKSVAVPTYLAGSQELDIFNLINAERDRCGFGKLAQDVSLDKSASMHTKYLIENNVYGHYEVVGQPFFTGVNTRDRANLAGFSGSSVGEGLAANFSSKDAPGPSLSGSVNVRGLLSAPFHAVDMLSPRQFIGIGHGVQPDGLFNRNTTVLDYGTSFASNGVGVLQDIPGNDVLTYPCEGTSGVQRGLFGENPSPYPNRDLSLNPIGASLYLIAKSGSNITVTSSELLNVTTNKNEVLLAPRYGDKEIYPGTNLKFSPAYLMNWVFISPDKILDAKTPYRAIIKGTVSGRDFTKTFTFTTS